MQSRKNSRAEKIDQAEFIESNENNVSTEKIAKFTEDLHLTISKSEHLSTSPEILMSFFDISSSFYKASISYLEKPDAFIQATHKLVRGSFELWNSAYQTMEGKTEKLDSIIQPDIADKRFKDPLWEKNPQFDFMMQAYLLYARWVEGIVEAIPEVSASNQRKVKFYSRQIVDALSPSNFAWANPTVVMKALETKGDNLFKGYNRYLEDLKSGMVLSNIKNTDQGAFKIGEDIALTKGKVIFQNDLMQLIQYNPKTEAVYKGPILVVPAWINKYYILDLRPGNSLVEWLVEQGHTVFIISWINPGNDHKHLTYEDYVTSGALEAIRVVKEITSEEQVHLMGYCLGGILLTVVLGYLQEKAENTIKSLTLMASPLDFTKAGELLLFTDPSFYKVICKKMEGRGVLDGAVMAATFNMLRANDLIWSAFINNYLLDNEPPQFDMLYWNADVTNLPVKMFKTYVEELFQKNNLIKKGKMNILGKPIDISKAKVPIFLLATRDDHISPWPSMFSAIKIFSGPVNFVLSGSGHVAGVVNHPAKNKYGYWINNGLVSDPIKWLEESKYTEGSWWVAWQQWFESTDHAGKVDSVGRIPGAATYRAIEDAPGSYVKVTAEEALRSVL